MSNKYILDKNSASKCLADALLDVRLKYEKMGVIVNTKFENTMYGSSTSSNPFLPQKRFGVSIGTKRYLENILTADGCSYVRSQDLVYSLHDIFHEERHVYQRAVLYQDKDANQNVVDMAKCDIVSGILKEYEKIVYHYKPSEVDAELYSWQKTIDYFDTHFLDKNGHPLIDARAEMLDELHDIEYDRNRGWSGDTWVCSYENAIKSLEENMDYYRYTTINLFKPRQRMSERYKQLIMSNNGRYVDSYMNAKTQVEANEVLFAFACDTGEVSTLAFPCLKESVKEVRSRHRKVVPKMPIYERMQYKSMNPFNPASKDNGLRFQDVESRMYDKQPVQAHSSNRPSVQQQLSRETSLDRLVRNIDCSDMQSDHDHEHNGLS